jgi:hypothetical protein
MLHAFLVDAEQHEDHVLAENECVAATFATSASDLAS